MSLWEIILYAIGLSMDAFAVAVCKGLALKKITYKEATIVGLWFGGFQALMPAIGFILASSFARFITSIDHWVAFVLLLLIGINMIKDANQCELSDNSLGFKTMLMMALATSIDALAVGVTFSFEIDKMSYLLCAVGIIGICTFALSFLGVRLGNVFGEKFRSKASIFGGLILIFLGVKILAEALLIG